MLSSFFRMMSNRSTEQRAFKLFFGKDVKKLNDMASKQSKFMVGMGGERNGP